MLHVGVLMVGEGEGELGADGAEFAQAAEAGDDGGVVFGFTKPACDVGLEGLQAVALRGLHHDGLIRGVVLSFDQLTAGGDEEFFELGVVAVGFGLGEGLQHTLLAGGVVEEFLEDCEDFGLGELAGDEGELDGGEVALQLGNHG